MNKYIEISLNTNLSLLDKNYNPDTDTTTSPVPIALLIELWSEITLEFSDLMDMGSLKSLLVRKAEIEMIGIKMMTVNNAVSVLQQCYDEELIGLLRELGYNFKFDPEDELKYLSDLERVLKQSKKLTISIKLKESEMVRLAPKEGEHKEKTLDDWENEKMLLEDTANRAIDWDSESVYRFATRYKNLIKKLKAQQKQLPKKR